ncbi:MAG TPA: type II toxin-antitoxin system VapC family toxin [Spirochaetota bacterium]|nr:type II toxin-antitoxin system VapC family toxin [Spirochaetota bacterium]
MEYLIDTNIIIYHLSGDLMVNDFIKKNIDKLNISFISYIEVLSYNFSKEEEYSVREFLKIFRLIDINKSILEKTIEIRKMKKIKLPDCIIASTAEIKNMILVTRNIKDFHNLGIQIVNLYENNKE